MAKLATLLCDEVPSREEQLLAQTLAFFGVPCKFVRVSGFSEEVDNDGSFQAVFGTFSRIAALLELEGAAAILRKRSSLFYAFADVDGFSAQQGLRSILGNSNLALHSSSDRIVDVEVSSRTEFRTHAMGGIRATLRMRSEDAIPAGLEELGARIETIISADGIPIFWRSQINGTSFYFCSSRYVIDLDQEVPGAYYDIKKDFCSAVPLLLFIRLSFEEVAWHSQELGACLIIDDPLLRKRYGCCNFEKMRELMKTLQFSTNIAFIPWNWWRTSLTAKDLFDSGSGPFSVSIHGCDHVNAEFGEQSQSILYCRAKLAQTRMQKHERRTGIHHERVMVFPQGVFSSECPEVLKQTGYIAAVNTEIFPVASIERNTRIRDVWDVAIMRYSDFAIFTRRYAHHGLENFAFDLLLGKPCLIVTHHEFFRDGNAAMIQLLKELRARNCSLKWQTLGAVVRKACRRRMIEHGIEEVEMYGSELTVSNSGDEAIRITICKRELDTSRIQAVRCDRTSLDWYSAPGYLRFAATVAPHCESTFTVSYLEPEHLAGGQTTGTPRASAAARRFLSEARDAMVGRFVTIDRVAKKLRQSGSKSKQKAIA